LARWLGSLERNGFSGRREAASLAAEPPGGVNGRGGWAAGVGGVGGGGGVSGGVAARGGVTDGVAARGAGADGAIGEFATGVAAGGGTGGRVEGAPGTNGGADGPAPTGARGGNAGVAGGDRNSGTLPDGDGGVAVAVIGPDSSRRRGGAGISAVRGGDGGADGVNGAAGGPKGGAVCVPGAVVRGAGALGVLAPLGAGIVMTPLQTEHRARTPLGGTFAGSTRKIERQSGQLTFIHSLRSCERRVLPAAAPVA
jgi:hypothetical protein